jgi:hypothetical protein
MFNFDMYQMDEFNASAASELDHVGSQPHAREYLERQLFGMRSDRKFHMIDDQVIDHPAGIHFGGTP